MTSIIRLSVVTPTFRIGNGEWLIRGKARVVPYMILIIFKGISLALFYSKSAIMKTIKKIFAIISTIVLFSSCGPVVLATRTDYPPPPWFYPNRLELVRYVYFPEFSIYYDLTSRTYLFLDAGVWIRVKSLPPSYRHVNLNRARYLRIRDFHDDNIARYHQENKRKSGRSNLNTPPRRNNP